MKHYKRVTYKSETRTEINNYFHPYYWDYYDNDNNNYYGYFYDDYVVTNYEYTKIPNTKEKYLISKRGGRITYIQNISNVLQIDMMSIYPKEVLRQKKIDKILGEDNIDTPNTIENILNSQWIQVQKDSEV